MAAAVASSVSSVPPEYDMAKNSVPGPTKRGARYCFSTVTGTVRSWEPAVASTSPEMPEPPIPQTAMLVIAAPERAPRSTAPAVDSASVNWSGRVATASTKPRVSITTGLSRRTAGGEGRGDALFLHPGEERLGVASREDGGLVEEHDGDVVPDLVAPPAGRAEEEPVRLEVVE